MPPEAIAENLLDLETARRDVPERQRSLRALFDQTWTRLSGEEQEVIGRLSVFPGSFAHDAAYAVSRATPPLLANLVARSLVQYQAENHRYQLHELLREYAEERLTELPEARLNALDRHADHYARLIEDQQEQIAMGHVGLVAPEMDNIRAAWEWALDRRNVPVLYRAVRSLLQTYQSNFHSDAIFASGALEDNRRPFERAVAVLRALPSGRERDLALGQCLVGVAAGTRGPERQKMYEEGLSLLRRHGPSPELAYAGLWVTTSAGGRFPVEENLRESLAIYSELGSKWGMCVCLLSLIFARLARVQVWPFDADTLDRVTDMCQQALTLAREMGSDVNMVWGLARMSWIEEAKGNYRGSLACIQQAISLCRQNGYVILAAQEQLDLVYFAIGAEEFDLAERVAEEACAFFRALGSPFFLRRARIRLAEIKYRLAKYVAARNYLEIVFAQAGSSNLPTEIDGRVALGYVALAQIANSEALNHFLAALRLGVGQAPDLFRIPEALLGIAYVWYRRGIVTQALDLLAVLAHCRLGPTYTPEWLRLQDTLEAELGPNAVADAIERGKDRGLLEIAREVLAELTEKRSTGEIGAPALEHKLLSERELEVLALVAAGKSNRQIATELYLALGTVKTHIHNVCEKLDAQSRTEAVAIARQMNLL